MSKKKMGITLLVFVFIFMSYAYQRTNKKSLATIVSLDPSPTVQADDTWIEINEIASQLVGCLPDDKLPLNVEHRFLTENAPIIEAFIALANQWPVFTSSTADKLPMVTDSKEAKDYRKFLCDALILYANKALATNSDPVPYLRVYAQIASLEFQHAGSRWALYQAFSHYYRLYYYLETELPKEYYLEEMSFWYPNISHFKSKVKPVFVKELVLFHEDLQSPQWTPRYELKPSNRFYLIWLRETRLHHKNMAHARTFKESLDAAFEGPIPDKRLEPLGPFRNAYPSRWIVPNYVAKEQLDFWWLETQEVLTHLTAIIYLGDRVRVLMELTRLNLSRNYENSLQIVHSKQLINPYTGQLYKIDDEGFFLYQPGDLLTGKAYL